MLAGNYPKCNSCEFCLEKKCILTYDWRPIADPDVHTCSHHPAFPQFLKSQREGLNSPGVPVARDIKFPFNCSCLKVGNYLDLYEGGANLMKSAAGSTLTCPKDCPLCGGTGIVK